MVAAFDLSYFETEYHFELEKLSHFDRFLAHMAYLPYMETLKINKIDF